MVSRILLAAILCLTAVYAVAQADLAPGRDAAEIHHSSSSTPKTDSPTYSHSDKVSVAPGRNRRRRVTLLSGRWSRWVR
jgi:hypothetical protein